MLASYSEIREGQLQITIEDRFSEQTAVKHYFLKTDTEILPLVLEGALAERLNRPDAFVRALGWVYDDCHACSTCRKGTRHLDGANAF
jgi:hypothetical protein